jgi:biopolymer transport protein TolR
MVFSNGDPSRPQINVTPFIDVLLVLIIIFIFLVVMSRPEGLEARIPQPAKSSEPQKETGMRIIAVSTNWMGVCGVRWLQAGVGVPDNKPTHVL